MAPDVGLAVAAALRGSMPLIQRRRVLLTHFVGVVGDFARVGRLLVCGALIFGHLGLLEEVKTRASSTRPTWAG